MAQAQPSAWTPVYIHKGCCIRAAPIAPGRLAGGESVRSWEPVPHPHNTHTQFSGMDMSQKSLHASKCQEALKTAGVRAGHLAWVYQGARQSYLSQGWWKRVRESWWKSGKTGVPPDPDWGDHKLRCPSASANGRPRADTPLKPLAQWAFLTSEDHRSPWVWS